MSYEWRYRPLFIGPSFVQCPKCERVFEDASYALYELTTSLPCCGATGSKPSWPSQAAQTFLAVIQHRDEFIEGGEPIRFAFLAAMLEALLEPIVFRLLLEKYGEVHAERELSENHGAAKLRRLFDRTSSKPLSALLKEAKFPRFSAQWLEIARMRNQFAHGKTPSVKPEQAAAAEQVQAVAFRAFAHIHHAGLPPSRERGG
jgi:hypothetical protein